MSAAPPLIRAAFGFLSNPGLIPDGFANGDITIIDAPTIINPRLIHSIICFRLPRVSLRYASGIVDRRWKIEEVVEAGELYGR